MNIFIMEFPFAVGMPLTTSFLGRKNKTTSTSSSQECQQNVQYSIIAKQIIFNHCQLQP